MSRTPLARRVPMLCLALLLVLGAMPLPEPARAAPPMLTVRGQVRYRDRNGAWVGARNFNVMLVKWDNKNYVYGGDYTDVNGNYAIGPGCLLDRVEQAGSISHRGGTGCWSASGTSSAMGIEATT